MGSSPIEIIRSRTSGFAITSANAFSSFATTVDGVPRGVGGGGDEGFGDMDVEGADVRDVELVMLEAVVAVFEEAAFQHMAGGADDEDERALRGGAEGGGGHAA